MKAPRSSPVRTYLAEWRRNAGLSQAALAERIGRDQTMVSRYERGTVPIPLDAVADIAAVFGIAPLHLFRPPDAPSIDAMLDGVDPEERRRIAAMVDAYLKSRGLGI